jgi:hypothetical protein
VRNTDDESIFRRIDVAAIIDGARVLFDDGVHRVLSLNSAPAAAWWGQGTRWCTAGSGWFAGYRQYGELIYIEQRPKQRRWQLYIHNCEFRNARNRRVNGQVFARNHPCLIDVLRSRIVADFRARLFFGLMPEGAQIEHSVNLRRIPIEALPKGLQIRDDLDLRATGIRSLPEGLKVGGDLLLSARATPLLPTNLEVGGRILCCDRWGAFDRPITAALPACRNIDA